MDVQKKLDSVDNLPYEMQSYINIAYYAGKQWLIWDSGNKRLMEAPKAPGQTRYTGNRIKKIVRTELSKIFKNKPIMQVIPASNNDDDIDASQIGDKVVEWMEYEYNLRGRDKKLATWGLTTNIVFMEPYLDMSLGEDIQDPETGEWMKSGDVNFDIVSLFECKFDPAAKEWDEVRWFCKMKPKDVDWIKEVYGIEVKPEKGIEEANIFESQLRNINANWNSTTGKEMTNHAIVKEYWEMPSSKYPKGRRITTAGDKVLDYVEDIGFGEEDTTKRILPFFPFIHINIPGRVQGQSIIEDLIPIQREYNITRSKIIEYQKKQAGKWVVQEESLTSDITDNDQQIIEYQAGFEAPRLVQPGNLSSDTYKNLEQLIEEFYFISGQQEVTHGATPPGVTSGVAIQFLQEQDDTVMAPTIENYIDCKQKYMSYALKIIRFNYKYERTLKLVGKNKEVELLSFIGSQLTSTDVRIQEGSMFQTSKAGKQQWIMNLVQSGLLNPQADKEMIFKMLELGIDDDLYDNTEIDRNQAQTEQLKWTKGEIQLDMNGVMIKPDVRDFYNHAVHLAEHNKFRKGKDYEELPPEIQKNIDLHCMLHQQMMAQQQQAAMMQMIPQGGVSNGM